MWSVASICVYNVCVYVSYLYVTKYWLFIVLLIKKKTNQKTTCSAFISHLAIVNVSDGWLSAHLCVPPRKGGRKAAGGLGIWSIGLLWGAVIEARQAQLMQCRTPATRCSAIFQHAVFWKCLLSTHRVCALWDSSSLWDPSNILLGLYSSAVTAKLSKLLKLNFHLIALATCSFTISTGIIFSTNKTPNSALPNTAQSD